MRLLLARHGVTLNNLQDRYSGQSDIELNDLGKRQAEALGKRLAHETLDMIVTSDLQRSRITAQIIAQHHALSVQEDANLREVGRGEWEGMSFAAVAARDPLLLERCQVDPSHYAPPGGETVVQVRDRLVHAMHQWQEQCPAGTVLWVTHAGAIGILLCHLLGVDLNRRNQFRPDNASITELELGDDYAILLCLNETAHLGAFATPSAGQW